MQIISTNIAKSTTIEWRGQKVETGIYKYAVELPIYLGKEDVVNDLVIDRRYHGGLDKACYLYSADHYPFWKTKYPDQDWQWGMFGENLTVQELSEFEIFIGNIYQIGEAVVQVTQPRQPCFKLGIRFGDQMVVDDFWHSPFPGIYVRILQSGQVQKGDEFVLIDQNSDRLSVSQVFSIFRSSSLDREFIQKAINNQFLAESCRRDIQKILDKQ